MHAVLAAAAEHDHSGILCTILLFATIVAFIIGLAELLGLDFLSSRGVGVGGRFGGIIVAVVLLIAYALFC